MHERFKALAAPRATTEEPLPEHWYEPEALEILIRTSELAKSDEFKQKEHDLGALFARLSVPESRALHKRLCNPATDDRLAHAFSRLVTERRGRLLTFLADARRREAIGAVCGNG